VSQTLRVLLVEDSENDAALLELELERAGYQPVCQRVDTTEGMTLALQAQKWDLVIADYVMPRFNGLDALALVRAKDLDIPFIIVSGHITDSTAVAAMKAGAHDYVMKDNPARLGPAVQRELREAEVRRWVHRFPIQNHLEVQVRPRGDASPADHPQFLTRRDGTLAFGKGRGDGAKMAVDADEAVMLHQHLQPTRAFALNSDYASGRRGHYRRPSWRGQVHTVMVGACFRLARQHARAERRGNAGRQDRRQQRRLQQRLCRSIRWPRGSERQR